MAVPAVAVRIAKDERRTFRVADTRVTLDVVLARYQRGRTPEQILDSFPTLKLADIYAVISYYLNNHEEIDAYLRQQREEAEHLRHEIEAKQPQTEPLHARLKTPLESSHQDRGCASSPTKTSTMTFSAASTMRWAQTVPISM